MSGRTPEERQRAAEERAARREGRERGDAGRAARRLRRARRSRAALEPVEPLPSARRRTAVADRPPMSRAARAQRVGRPGRPALPPSVAQAALPPLVPPHRRPAGARLHRRGALGDQLDVPALPGRGRGGRRGRRQDPARAPTRARSGELLEAKGVIEDARFFEINATVTFRRGDLITGNYVLRRNMTNGAAIEALMQGPEVKVVKTFDVTIPEGLSIRESRAGDQRERHPRQLPQGGRQPRGARPGARARPAEGRRHARGLPLPGDLPAPGRRDGARPGRQAARRVRAELRQAQPQAGASARTSTSTTS